MNDRLRKRKDEASSLMLKGKFEKALELFEEIVRVDTADLATQLQCGHVLRKLKRDPEAISYYVRVAKAYSDDSMTLKAIAACKLALEIEPDHVQTNDLLKSLYDKRSGGSSGSSAQKTLSASLTKATPAAGSEKAAEVKPLAAITPVKIAAASQVATPPKSSPPPVAATPLRPSTPVTPATSANTRDAVSPSPPVKSAPAVQPIALSDSGPVAPSIVTPKVELSPLPEGYDSFEYDALVSDTLAHDPLDVTIDLPAFEAADADMELALADEAQSLPEIPLFSDLPRPAFARLVDQMQVRTVSVGDVIIREGDTGTSMFIISQGAVRIWKKLKDNKDVAVARLAEGAFFGEISLLTDAPRTATVTADEESIIFEVNREAIEDVIEHFPSVRNMLLRFYRSRLVAQLIAASPALASLNKEHRVEIVQKFVYREVPQDRVVLKQGQIGDGLYMVVTGRLQVLRTVGAEQLHVADLKPGDIFGEMSLLNHEPINADVIAQTKCIVLRMSRGNFLELASVYPQFLADLSDISTQRGLALEELEKTLDIQHAKLKL